MHVVSSRDDPWMVVGHSLLVRQRPRQSVAIIPALSPTGLFDAVLRCGAGCAMSGTGRLGAGDDGARRPSPVLMGGDHRALVLISHQGVDRREVLDVLAPTMA